MFVCEQAQHFPPRHANSDVAVGISVAVVAPLIFLAFKVNSMRSFLREEWLPTPLHGPDDAEADKLMDTLHDSDTDGPQTYRPGDNDLAQKKKDKYAPLFGNQTWHRKVPIIRKLWKKGLYWHTDPEHKSRSRPRDSSRSTERSRFKENKSQRRKPGHVVEDYPLHRYLPWMAQWLGSEPWETETVIEEEIIVGRRRSPSRRIIIEEVHRPSLRTRFRDRRRTSQVSISTASYVTDDSIPTRYARGRRGKKRNIFFLLIAVCLRSLSSWWPPWKKRSRATRRPSWRSRSRSPPRRISHTRAASRVVREGEKKKITFRGILAGIGLLFKALWSGLMGCSPPWKKRKRNTSPVRSTSYYSYSSGYDSSYESSSRSHVIETRVVRPRRRSRSPRVIKESDDEIVVIEESSPERRIPSRTGFRTADRRESSSDSGEAVIIEERPPRRRRRPSDSSDDEEETTVTSGIRFPNLARLPNAIQQRLVRRRERRKAREEISEAEEGRALAYS